MFSRKGTKKITEIILETFDGEEVKSSIFYRDRVFKNGEKIASIGNKTATIWYQNKDRKDLNINFDYTYDSKINSGHITSIDGFYINNKISDKSVIEIAQGKHHLYKMALENYDTVNVVNEYIGNFNIIKNDIIRKYGNEDVGFFMNAICGAIFINSKGDINKVRNFIEETKVEEIETILNGAQRIQEGQKEFYPTNIAGFVDNIARAFVVENFKINNFLNGDQRLTKYSELYNFAELVDVKVQIDHHQTITKNKVKARQEFSSNLEKANAKIPAPKTKVMQMN